MGKRALRITFVCLLLLAASTAGFGQRVGPATPPAPVRLNASDIAYLRGVVAAPGFAEALKNGTLSRRLGGPRNEDRFWKMIAALNAGVFAIEMEDYQRRYGVKGQAKEKIDKVIIGLRQRYAGNWDRNLANLRANMPVSRAVTSDVVRIAAVIPDNRKAPPAAAPPWTWPGFLSGNPDITVDTREAVLQKFVAAAFPIQASGGASTDVSVPMPDWCGWHPCIGHVQCSAGYSWKVATYMNHVNIRSSGIPFDGKVETSVSADLCSVGPSLTYSPAVQGELGAKWQAEAERIDFTMQSLNVEIYVNVPLPDFLGGDQHYTLGWVDVSTLLPNPLWSRQVHLSQQLKLPLPGGDKILTLVPVSAQLKPYDGYLRVVSDVSVK